MKKLDGAAIVAKFDEIAKRGFCIGVGKPDDQMCVEAAISQAMGLPFNDEPACVDPAIRQFKIRLNDSPRWKSAQSRAKGLRDLGIAQIGSAGVVDGKEFSRRIAEKAIRIILPTLFRELKITRENVRCMAAADRCEKEGSAEAAREARDAADAVYAVYAADAAAYAADAEKYLRLSASLALDVLRELKSPGCEWLEVVK